MKRADCVRDRRIRMLEPRQKSKVSRKSGGGVLDLDTDWWVLLRHLVKDIHQSLELPAMPENL